MLVTRLTWAFAGLVLLFGLPLLALDDPGWSRLCVGMSTMSLGGFALSMVRDALKSGQIRLNLSTIQHARQPRLFWTAIGLVTIAGIVVLITGLWFLFFKA